MEFKIRRGLVRFFQKEPVVILIGQTNSGKGTVKTGLINLHNEVMASRQPCFHSETGQLFRNAIEQGEMSAWNTARIADIQSSGYLQSWVGAVIMWGKKFFELYNGGPIFLDGSPRSMAEVNAMVNFYHGYAAKDIIAIVFDISDEVAEARMVERIEIDKKAGKPERIDTATSAARKIKLGTYYTHVRPAISCLESKDEVTVYFVNAEQPKEVVFNEVVQGLAEHY